MSVIFAKTILEPREVLKEALSVEKKLERVRRIKNEPRTCDIDLIDYKIKLIIDLSFD